MRTKKFYTPEELETMRQMKQSGASWSEIASAVGHSVRSVQLKMYQAGMVNMIRTEDAPRNLVKVKTLDDFTPREIIKHLYDLGYRIEGEGRIVLVKKEYVNLKSILED